MAESMQPQSDSIARATRRLDRVATELWELDDPEDARRARVLSAIVGLSMVGCLVGTLSLALDPRPERALFLLGIAIPLGGTLFVLKRTGRVDYATHWMCAWSMVGTCTSTFFWSGVFSVYGLLLAVPVVASAAAGSRAGLGWTAIVTVVLSVIATRFASGPLDESAGLTTALASTIVGITLAIAESARERAFLERETAVIDAARVRAERVRAEEELVASRTLFSAAFAHAPSSLVVTDLETGEILDVNERWIDYFGHSREHAIGRTMVELGVWGDDASRRSMLERVVTGDLREVEVPLHRKDGSEMWILSSVQPIEFDGRQCLVCQGIDITERRRAEASLSRYRDALEDFVLEHGETVDVDRLRHVERDGRDEPPRAPASTAPVE